MPDFNSLYNPDLSDAPVQVPLPNLKPIQDPFQGYNPDAGINHIDNALARLDNNLYKTTTDRLLQPVGYDRDATNEDRYRNSSYYGELGFNPMSNNEERYGLRQTNWNKLGNAFGGMWQLVKNQFVEQTGSWGDTLNFFKDQRGAFEQADFDEINKQQKDLLNNNPIFETAAQRDSLWNFNTIANTIQQSGYAVGAISEIAAEELAMSLLTTATFGATSELQAARTARLAASIGSVMRRTEQMSEGMNTVSRLRKVLETINKVNPLLDNSLAFASNLKSIARIDRIAFGGSKLATARTVARGFGSLYRDVREFNAAIAEAKAEAAGSYQDLKTVLTDEYRKGHNGQDPKGPDAQKIEDTAMGAAQTNGVANTWLILLSNKIGMGNIMRGFKGLRAIEESAENGILKLGIRGAEKTGVRLADAASNKWLDFKQHLLRTPLTYLKTNFDEALQENLQDISHDAVQSYYHAKYNGDQQQPLKNISDDILNAAANQFQVQGAKTFISGFLTGAIIGPGEYAFGKVGNIKQFVFDRSGYRERQANVRQARNEIIDAGNKIWKDPLNFDYKVGDTTLQANLGALLGMSARAGSKDLFYEMKDDALRHFVLTGIRSGALDSFTQRLKSYTEHLSPEEFTGAFGMEFSEKNRNAILSQISVFSQRADEIGDLHERASQDLKNPFDPFRFKTESRNGQNPEYVREALSYKAWNDAVDNYVFIKGYYQDTISRQKNILAGLKDKPGFKDTAFNDFYLLSSRDHLSAEIDNLHREIKNMQSDKDNAGTQALIRQKRERLSLLQKYSQHLEKWSTDFDEHSKLPVGDQRDQAFDNSFAQFKEKATPLFSEIINQELTATDKPRITKDMLDDGFDNFHDYLKLQKRAGIVLDKVNLLADPANFSKFFTRHVELLQAAYRQQREDGNEPSDKASASVSFKDDQGIDHTRTFTVGETYVGKLSSLEKYRGQGKTAQQFNNDKIKIAEISQDGKTISVSLNGEPAVDMDAEEVARLAHEQKWRAYSQLTPIQRTYLGLRNKVITYRVLRRDGNGTPLRDEHGRYITDQVNGRVKLNEKKDTLLFAYGDKTQEFNPKYVVNQQDLTSLPTVEQQGLADQQQRQLQNFQTQSSILEASYKEAESKLQQVRQLTEANQQEFEKTVKDLSDLQAHLDLVIEELENKPYKGKGRRTNENKSLLELQETLSKEIGEKNIYLQRLTEQRDQLQNSYKALVKARDLYVAAWMELQDAETPFDREGQPNLYTGTSQQLQALKNSQISRRLTDDQIEQLIGDTKNELEIAEDRIRLVKDLVTTAEKALRKISKFDDILTAISDIIDKRQLIRTLATLKSQTDDEEKKSILSALIKGLNRGDQGFETQYILEKAQILKQGREELSGLLESAGQLTDKYDRLIAARKQRNQINALQDRIDFLKELEDTLSAGYGKIKAKEAILRQTHITKARTAGIPSELHEFADTTPQIPVEGTSDDALIEDVYRPRLDQIGLFKTAGRHYMDDSDPQPSSPEAGRFYKLTEGLTPNGTLFLQAVGASNDNFGIRTTEAYNDDLKLIVVKKQGDEYHPVGIDGAVLDQPAKTNLVYTSMHGNADLLEKGMADAVKWVRDNFATKSLSDADIEQKVLSYRGFRQSVKERLSRGEKVILNIIDKSVGIQAHEPLDVHTGRPQELPLTGRLIRSDISDWSQLEHPDGSPIQLEVSTTGSVLNKKVKAGRLAMVKKDGSIFQVYNRQLNADEKQNLIAVLKRVAPLMGRRYLDKERLAEIEQLLKDGKISPEQASHASNPLTESEQDQFDKAIHYLMGTLYWRQAREGEAIGKDQFRVFKGMLYRGDLAIPFNAEEIEKQKDALLDGLYHQVNNKKTGESNVPFYELFEEDGMLKEKRWDNYVRYLLDSSDSRESPVYTNVKPYVSKTDPESTQLRSVYLIYGAVEEKSTTPAPLTTFQEKGSYTDPMDIPREPGHPIAFIRKKLDKKTDLKVIADWQENKFKVIKLVDEHGEDFTDRQDVVQKNEDYINITIGGLETNRLVPDLYKTELNAFKNVFHRIEPYQEATVIQQNTETAQQHDAKNTVAEPVVNTLSQTEIDRLVEAATRTTDPDIIDENARLALTEDPELKDNIEEFREWMKERLPQIPVEKVLQLINGRNWGQFIDGAIQLYQNAELGTGYHEAFEAVWNSYLTPQEQHELSTEFRDRGGNFTNPFSGQDKEYSQASPYDVREMLAEEFRDYVLRGVPQVRQGSPVRNTIFRRLWNFIKRILGLTQGGREELSSKIQDLFSRIEKGDFANRVPVTVSSDPAFRALKGNSVEFTQQVMEGMASIFFSKLYLAQQNIEALFGKGDNVRLFNDLYRQTKEAVSQYFNAPVNGIVKVLTEKGVPRETIRSEVMKYTNGQEYRQKKSVLDRFEGEVLQEFKKYISQFGLQFRESGNVDEENLTDGEDNIDEIETKEQSATDALGIRDAIYVDPRNMTKSTVRLLIASLTADEYKPSSNQVQIRKNGLGLPTLEDYGRKLNILLNELHGAVPVYRSGKRVEALDVMFQRLDDRFKNPEGHYRQGFEWIQKLKTRLKYELNGQRVPFEHLSDDEVRLLIGFESSFSNNKNLPYKLLVGESGVLTAVDPVVVTNAAKVKERWQNSLKSGARLLKAGESLTNAPVVFIGTDGRVMFNRDSEHMKRLLAASTNQNKLDSLQKMGIMFSQTDKDILANPEAARSVAEAFNGISYAFREGLINSFDDLFNKQVVNGPISQLLSIELQSTAEDNILSHQNAAGKQQFSITLPSALSNIINSLKAVDNLKDFVLTNPQYGSVGGAGEILLNPYQAGSQLLKVDGLLFDKSGKKKRNIDYQFILGMSLLNDNEGDNTDDLKYPDKIVQEIYHLLNGTYYTVINSDKSSEFGLNIGHFISWTDIKKPIPENDAVMASYRAALLDEIKAAVFEQESPSNIQYYGEGVKFLGHFRDVLKFITKETRDKKFLPLQRDFMDRVLTGKETPEDFVSRPQVNALIKEYLQKQVDTHRQYLVNMGVVQEIPVNEGIVNYASNAFSSEQLEKLGISDGQKLSEVEFTNLVKYLTINRQIGVFEQHKLLYGHPALYKDLAKRSNGINSQKEAVTENRDILTWMDGKMPRIDGKIRGEQERSTFRFISYQDPTAVSLYHKDIAEGMYVSLIKDLPHAEVEQLVGATFTQEGKVLTAEGGKGTYIDAYINANEPDGQAYIMMDFFRDMLYLSGKFSKEQAALWEYERAEEIVDRSRPDSQYYKSYPSGEIEDAKDLLQNNKPKGVLQTLKPQGFGYQTTDGITHTTFLKHSVFPLTWSRVKDHPNMVKLYTNAQDRKVDIIGFESGEKVGNVLENGGFVPLYDDAGRLNPASLPLQEMYTKYYGIQVEMAAKTKEKVVLGTQMRKLILSNLPESLKPQAEAYFKTLESLMSLDKTALLKELGLQRNPDGSYRTESLSNLVETLRSEAISRDLPDNVIDMISAVQTEAGDRLAYQFDANPIREKIDNILNAIVDARVISQKMFGKASVQVASTLWEKEPRNFMYLKDGIWTSMEGVNKEELTRDEQKSIRMVSSELKFYTKDEPWMEVMLPHYFEGILPAEIKGAQIDPRLLEAIGFRIPTQGMNSIENIRIKGFLDPSMGDIIVVPSEIVGKSGSDFDIDKLNIYLPNYKVIRKDGKTIIEYVDPAGNTKDALQNRLIQQMGEILSHPDNYRQLVIPNGAETLKGLADEIRQLKGLEKEGASLTRLSEWKTMIETRERYISGKKLVGIGALQITSHTVSQLAGVELTGTYKGRDGQELPVKIKFDHNEQAGKFYLTAIKDKGNQYISELLSEALTGFVDAAKDPFIFDLNLNLQTAATWFYLQKLGVPVRELAYLHTQPLIEKYFAEQGKNESYVNKANDAELVKEMVIFKAAEKYFQTAFPTSKSLYQLGLPDSTGKWRTRKAYFKLKEDLLSRVNRYRDGIDKYSYQQLRDNIRKQNERGYQLTREDAIQQLGLLYDFLDYQQQAGYLSNFINAIAYDTARTKNIIENRIQDSTLQVAYSDNFITPASINSVFDTTFLGAVKDHKQDISNMFRDFFVSLHPNAQPIFEKVEALINNPALGMTKDKKTEVLNRFQNYFITALLHTVKFKAGQQERSLNDWYGMFFGDQSLPGQLKALQEDPRFRNNPALKQLFPLINTDRAMTDNIKLFNNKLSTYEINIISEALLNIKQQADAANDDKLSRLVGRLGIFAILQSGVQTSPITFTKILPIDMYSRVVGEILDRFTDQEPGILDPDILWKQFFQNNWYNTALVPRVRKFSRESSGLISIPGSFRTSQYEYISTRELKPEYGGKTNELRESLVKQKKWDDLYNYGLYERIRMQDEKGNDITQDQPVVYYRPINRLGNRMYMTEAYSVSRESMLPKNEPFDESQYDDAVDEITSKIDDGPDQEDNHDDLPCEGGTPF